MRHRTTAAALALAALLVPGMPAHADDAYFTYWKWYEVWNEFVWELQPVNCNDGTETEHLGPLLCNQHGYEHDDDGAIDGHQRGQSWDCKYPYGFGEVQPPTTIAPPGTVPESVADLVARLWHRVLAVHVPGELPDPRAMTSQRAGGQLLFVDPDGPPECPPLNGVGAA
jgi:hypothetical protein